MSAEEESIFLTKTGRRFSIISLWWVIRSLLCFAKASAIKYSARLSSSMVAGLTLLLKLEASQFSIIYESTSISYGRHVFVLKAELLSISRNGKVMSNPPLREENSDFDPLMTLRRVFVFITLSSPRDYPSKHLLKASVMY